MHWITATDLKAWANTRPCQELLPELIDRLVRASVKRLERAEFPSGDSVQTGGWDGICETREANSYVPAGVSGWEFGVGRSVNKKATTDFEKRSDNSLGLDRASSTFVFVTARPWKDKQEWVEQNKDKGGWADVRGYNADDLARWIGLYPSVGAWLAQKLHKYIGPIQSLNEVWEEEARSTNPPLTKTLLLAGRDAQVRVLLDWLSGAPSVLVLEADSNREAMAFLAALDAHEADGADGFKSRTLVSDSVEALRSAAAGRDPVVLVWRSRELAHVPVATANGHHVVIVSAKGEGTSEGSRTPVVLLPTPSKEDFADALSAGGLSEEQALKLATDSGRSITRLKRLIPSSICPQPEWAEPPIAEVVKPALLAGHWEHSRNADREVLQSLGTADYATWANAVVRIAAAQDSPVRKVGDRWTIVAPADAWQLLTRHLTDSDLERFSSSCIGVLAEDDPALTVSTSERWRANILDKEFTHSSALRHGLAQTVALLSAKSPLSPNVDLKRCAEGVVDRLLYDATPSRWYSLGRLLPLLAEAAPKRFLDHLGADLAQATPSVTILFGEDDAVFPSFPHAPLLWALESLAWYPEYLGRVAVTLAKLATVDPRANSGNSPRVSLASIFISWQRHTAASLQQRVEVLELVLTKAEQVGWQLLTDCIPEQWATTSETYRPVWREMPPLAPVTVAERVEYEDAIIRLAIKQAGHKTARLAQLIQKMASLSQAQRDVLHSHIADVEEQGSSPTERTEVWGALREFVHHHRRFPGANWSLPEDALRPFDALIAALEPKDIVEASLYIFDSSRPYIPEGVTDTREQLDAVERFRKARLTRVLESYGLDGVYRLALAVKMPSEVAETLCQIDMPEEQAIELACHCLGNSESALRTLGLVRIRSLVRDRSLRTLQDIKAGLDGLNPASLADFFIGHDVTSEVLDCVEDSPNDVQQSYWSGLSYVACWRADVETRHRAIRGLLKHSQARTAFSVVAHEPEVVESSLVMQSLDALALEFKNDDRRESHEFSYYLQETIGSLRQRQEVSRDELLRLEWYWLPLLRNGSQLRVPTLQNELLSNPRFFCYMVTLMYPPKDVESQDAPTPPSEAARESRSRANRLLDSLDSVPGQHGNDVNSETLGEWIDAVRAESQERGLLEATDFRLGNLLATAPPDPDGMWPHRAVRTLLEHLESADIEATLGTGRLNQDGASCRDPRAGGQPEHAAADQYAKWSKTMASRWPRAAVVLGRLSASYRGFAKHHDDDAELRDLD